MRDAVKVVFREIPPTPSLEATIRRKAEKLFRLCEAMNACRVTVSLPHAHHHKGHHYHVRIEMAVPGAELVAGRDPELDASHANPYVAARDAFRAARRMLKAHTRRRLGTDKQHAREGHAARENGSPDFARTANVAAF